MPNMRTQVSRHNSRILREATDEAVDPCDCTLFECPLNGECQKKNVVYQATVTVTDTGHQETYVGATNHFKTRFRNHRTSLNNPKYKGSTTLSKYVWKLKEEKKAYTIKWRIIDRAPAFNPITKRCNLCNKEKFYIIYRQNLASLNKRNELYRVCFHRRTELLINS